MQTILTYYKSLNKRGKRVFINRYSDACGISEATLLAKVNGKREFNKLEKEKLQSELGDEICFPEESLQVVN